MAKMTNKQDDYIRKLATSMQICSFDKLAKLAKLAKSSSFAAMTSDQASAVIETLKAMMSDEAYRQKVITYIK